MAQVITVTLKDHKDNFMNRPTTRLINPSKNEAGRISKHILDQINTELVRELSVNEWKNTISLISKMYVDQFQKK